MSDLMEAVAFGFGCLEKIGCGQWKLLGLSYGRSPVEVGFTPSSLRVNAIFTTTT